MLLPDYSKAVWDGKPIAKFILWKSEDEKYVVIEGPVPSGFIRCNDNTTKAHAINRIPYVSVHDKRSKPGFYIKCLAKNVVEVPSYTDKGEEICP